MQKNRDHLLAGNAQSPRMQRMKMRDAHSVGPVAVDLRVDAPFERDQSARMLDDRAVDVEHEDVLRAHRGLFGAGAGTDEDAARSRHADRHVSEHADGTLQAQHSRHCRGLFAQQRFIAHDGATSA